MTIHEMKLQPAPFFSIRSGEKIIESRLYDEKRQQIQLGDRILFRNMADLDDVITVQVDGLLRYPTFVAMFNDFDPVYFGGTSKEFLAEQIYTYHSKEDEARYGVLGIRVSKIEV
jgi:ASC-1-like (ASCH) protein